MPASSTASLAIAGRCSVPLTARAVSLNLTVVTPAAPGFVTIYPGNGLAGTTSAINFVAGKTVANNAVGPLATDGDRDPGRGQRSLGHDPPDRGRERVLRVGPLGSAAQRCWAA